jgi:hypothetical protein
MEVATEASGSFLKKRTKKPFYPPWNCRGVETPESPPLPCCKADEKASFCSQKEGLV